MELAACEPLNILRKEYNLQISRLFILRIKNNGCIGLQATTSNMTGKNQILRIVVVLVNFEKKIINATQNIFLIYFHKRFNIPDMLRCLMSFRY
jgi:hypothetical protein